MSKRWWRYLVIGVFIAPIVVVGWVFSISFLLLMLNGVS